MAGATLVDYYAVLNLPHDADLNGIENAYARLSDELALGTDLDEGYGEALKKVNEAYGVLSKPDLRRRYDSVFLAREREWAAREAQRLLRRRLFVQRIIVGALSLIVLAQAAGLAYLGREQVTAVLSFVLGPLFPGSAG